VKLTRKQLRKLILEYSAPEKKYFGKGIAALIENPDMLYVVQNGEQVLNRPWLEANVGRRLGGGSFRDAYEILGRDDLILKISNRMDDPSPDAGIDYSAEAELSNQNELDFFNRFPEFFPKVYAYEREPDGSPRLSLPRWLVIEKAKVITTWEEMGDQIKKVFPGIENAYNFLNLWFNISPIYHGVNDAIIEHDKKRIHLFNENYLLQILFHAAIRGNNLQSGTLFEKLAGLKIWDEKGLTFEQKVEILERDVLSKLREIFLKDINIVKFNRVTKLLENSGYFFDYNEIVVGNVGTDLNGEGFKLIDISLFDKDGEYGIG
jgi:hypothetical protein